VVEAVKGTENGITRDTVW